MWWAVQSGMTASYSHDTAGRVQGNRAQARDATAHKKAGMLITTAFQHPAVAAPTQMQVRGW